MEKSKEIKKKIAETEEREQGVIKKRDAILCSMGNLVHDSVPISQDEVGAGITGPGLASHPLHAWLAVDGCSVQYGHAFDLPGQQHCCQGVW